MPAATSPTPVQIAPRYCGPPGTGNGGMVCAILAAHCGPSLEVTLRRPAPLSHTLWVRPPEAGGPWTLADGADTIAEARPVELDLAVPPSPGWAEAECATRAADPARHPFPHCFVCGPARAPGDGLRTITGPVRGGAGLYASAWQPHPGFAGDDGFVEDRYLWAALDCPGGVAAIGERDCKMVLGRCTGRLEGRVRAGDRCVAIGWSIARSGRKHTAGTAVFDADGRVVGRAVSIWFELAQPAVEAAPGPREAA